MAPERLPLPVVVSAPPSPPPQPPSPPAPSPAAPTPAPAAGQPPTVWQPPGWSPQGAVDFLRDLVDGLATSGALGSALASIGLTVPSVVLASILLDMPLELGIQPKDMVLLVLSFIVGVIGLGNGRTNLMQGAVQLVIFAAFLFLALVP